MKNNMNYPLISVITVSYNAVLTIEQTILSVINQTYLNIEYIIIDGGSTDGTVNVIKKYADKIAYWGETYGAPCPGGCLDGGAG